MQVGVDIGGTFTDFTVVDTDTGARHHAKRATTVKQPATAVVDGLLDVLAEHGHAPAEVRRFVHGQTIALNTVLQRRGERLGLVVTRGFRDILELRRLHLGKPVDLFAVRPEPLIPRSRVVEADERMLADGSVDTPLDVSSLLDGVAEMRAEHGVDDLVVAFLHAHARPGHEQAAKRALLERWPELTITCSHEVWPEIREYERTVAAVLNAYVRQRMDEYLTELQRTLREAGVTAPCLVTKSNGGVTGLDDARGNAIQTMLSGPASGIAASHEVLSSLGFENAVTLDMGGTSTDIAVVRDGGPVTSRNAEIGDFPVVLPAIEITSIGAGGGSVVRVDESGVLKVGPESAGAEPGPACYGLGGGQPTLTDAFLLCGFLGAEIAGGRVRLDEAAAHEAFGPVAARLGVEVRTAAELAVQVATSSLHRGVSTVIARSGLEPKQSVLVAFGGAGPIQACALATELRIPAVLVPASPGTLCATGAVVARPRADFVRTLDVELTGLDAATYRMAADSLRTQATAWSTANGFTDADRVSFQYAADMRYARQSYEIEVPVPEPLDGPPDTALREIFAKTYAERYGMTSQDRGVHLVSLRLLVTVDSPLGATPTRPEQASGLAPGESVEGATVIELPDSTIVVDAGYVASMDEAGNVLLRSNVDGEAGEA